MRLLFAVVFFISTLTVSVVQTPGCSVQTFTQGPFKAVYKLCDGLLTDSVHFYSGPNVFRREYWKEGRYNLRKIVPYKSFGDQENFVKAFYKKVRAVKYKSPVAGQPFLIELRNCEPFYYSFNSPTGILKPAAEGVMCTPEGKKGDTLKVFVRSRSNEEFVLLFEEVLR